MGSLGKDRARETLQVEPCRVGTGGLQPDGGKERRPCPAPSGVWARSRKKPREMLWGGARRKTHFLDCFYSKEPREEMGSGGKT